MYCWIDEKLNYCCLCLLLPLPVTDKNLPDAAQPQDFRIFWLILKNGLYEADFYSPSESSF